MSEVDRLQAWYLAQCDGDWEHSYGITLGTLDNPGWRLKVDLVGTALAGRPFETVEHGMEPDEADWLRCWVDKGQFHGACGAPNLSAMLSIFLDWAEAGPFVA